MRSLRVLFGLVVPFAALAIGLLHCESDDSRYPASFTAPDATVTDGAKPDSPAGDTGTPEDTGTPIESGADAAPE